jgi:hypothetical protein
MKTYAESNLYLRSKVSSVWALTFLTLPRLKFQKYLQPDPDVAFLRYEESWRDLTSFKGKVSSAWALAISPCFRMRNHYYRDI